MTRSKFYEILNGILFPVIDETAKKIDAAAKFGIGEKLRQVVEDSKQTIYEKYESMRMDLKKNFMKKPETYIDRFKIAALLYIAFTESISDSNFFDFKDNKTLKYLFVHKTAFNLAIAIIENFIYADEKKHGMAFCLYVKKHGIINKTDKNVHLIIDRFIATYEKNKSLEPTLILLFADVFHSIECRSRERFEKTNLLNIAA